MDPSLAESDLGHRQLQSPPLGKSTRGRISWGVRAPGGRGGIPTGWLSASGPPARRGARALRRAGGARLGRGSRREASRPRRARRPSQSRSESPSGRGRACASSARSASACSPISDPPTPASSAPTWAFGRWLRSGSRSRCGTTVGGHASFFDYSGNRDALELELGGIDLFERLYGAQFGLGGLYRLPWHGSVFGVTPDWSLFAEGRANLNWEDGASLVGCRQGHGLDRRGIRARAKARDRPRRQRGVADRRWRRECLTGLRLPLAVLRRHAHRVAGDRLAVRDRPAPRARAPAARQLRERPLPPRRRRRTAHGPDACASARRRCSSRCAGLPPRTGGSRPAPAPSSTSSGRSSPTTTTRGLQQGGRRARRADLAPGRVPVLKGFPLPPASASRRRPSEA